MKPTRFNGILEAGRGGGAVVTVPPQVVVALGGTRCRVRGTLNGVEFASSTMPTGSGNACLGVHKATRVAAGVQVGGRVTVEIEPDTSERRVAIPDELAGAFEADPALRAAYERLALSHRREFAEWIAGAKRPETRRRRVEETIARLRAWPAKR